VFQLILSFVLNSIIRITIKEILVVSLVLSSLMILIRVIKLILK
jgi:hypothetical protein